MSGFEVSRPAVSLAITLTETNQRPNRAQETQIRAGVSSLQDFLRKTEAEFCELDFLIASGTPATPDTDINELREQLARLSLTLSTTRDDLEMCKSCISFTRRVPVEVMQLIFCMCLPQTDYITPDPTSAPLLLSQISHSWRRLALATPQLWCSLSVCISRRRGFWKSFLESWLGRSGDIPISLQISRKPQCVSYSNEYFNEHIIKLLVKDSKRWRRLSLDTPAVSMTRLLNYSMPMLEILELGNNCDKPSGLLLSSVDVPRLHTVCLLSSTVDLIPPLLFAPLERLVQFQAPNYILDLPNCFTVLGKCVRLERCTIQLSLATVDASQLDLPALRMPRLHTFAVLGDAGQGGAVCSLLENITLPALERLELSAHTWYNKREFYLGPDSPIISLARQSRCALRTLHLKGGAFGELFDTVVAIPSLKEVYLASHDGLPIAVPDVVMEALNMRK